MIVATNWLSELHCIRCGDAAVMTVAPGSEPEHGPGDILLQRGVAVSGWCLTCATQLGWLTSEASQQPTEARAAS
jgi:hypothetical protein